MNQTKKLVYTALFTALCCVGTMVIQIPTPATHGYIHLGDAFVILSGVILGKKYGSRPPVSAPPLPTFSPAMLTMLPRLLLSNS